MHVRQKKRRSAGVPEIALLLVLVVPGYAPTHAQSEATDMETLRQELRELRRRDEENRKRMESLERALERLQTTEPARVESKPDTEDALDRALAEVGQTEAPTVTLTSAQPTILSRQMGGMNMRLIDISFDILTAAGTSTERNRVIDDLQAGAHDPKKRGFTLQQGEVSLAGAVDPYFVGEAHMVFVPSGVELEEAFFTTQALPYGVQLEGGYSLTEFGLINPLHAHAWEFIDQPIVVSRLLGFEGLRSPGARLAWLTPLPWFSEIHFGVQNADEGSLTRSFAGSSIGGRPTFSRDVRSLKDLLYLARWNNSWDVTSNTTVMLGFSSVYGPNASGDDGETWIYGADLKVRWRPPNSFMGWPYVTWQTEVMKRDYTADWFLAGSLDPSDDGGGDDHGHSHGGEPDEDDDENEFPNDLPGGILRDAGFYTQLLYGFQWGWEAGLRFEYVGGSGPSVAEGVLVSRQRDPYRDDRFRLSPLLTWRPTEFSRLRLQYNYDNARHLSGNDAHSIWLGAEVLYGSHAAHRF